jgi:hypothetical protein
MIQARHFLTLLLMFCIATNACSQSNRAGYLSPASVYVGSTPGDPMVKSMLNLPADTMIDFIRWDLVLQTSTAKEDSFVLNIAYGESQPNTLGFKRNGQRALFKGSYTATQSKNEKLMGTIYHLKTHMLPTGVLLVKLNENLLHLLRPQKGLMVGNGGWSYTLNRKQPVPSEEPLPALTMANLLMKDTALQIVYDGRTPCAQFANDYQLNVTPGCFKLKWRLILNRDPVSLQPTTYIIKRTDSRAINITGHWKIIKGTLSNPDAIIYQLDPDKPEKSISLLAGDKNVLFFLHKNQQLYVGNSDFSYTLNKIVK